MNGYIVKGIGGFYYVRTEAGIIECKPRGIFRKQKITPVAGDEVTVETENGASVIAEIAPRKNVFVRPPVANLDVLFLVASTTQPTPSTLVLDKLSAIAVDKGVQPVIVCTKADLGEAEFLRKAYERSTLPFIAIHYDTGEGLDEVKQWIAGRLCAFCGNSGVGKSTLFKTIVGLEPLTSGELKIGDTVKISYVDQNREGLDPNKNLWEAVSGGLDFIEVAGVEVPTRAYVASFGFKGADQQKLTGVLSGGERNRLNLALTLKQGGNLLLLDEPTNDLDVETLESLENALLEFPGCAVVISHDRWFLDRVATHILAWEGDDDNPAKWYWFEGNFQAYQENRVARLGEDAARPHRLHRKLTR